MNLRFYQAECGDAARIRYEGNDNRYHNILLDAGYERTFRQVLINEIKKIQSKGEIIDLWIISHIHDDHIGGAIAYLKAVKDGELNDIVDSWFYNFPRSPALDYNTLSESHLISTPKSITQGDFVAEYLLSIGKPPLQDTTNELPVIDLYGLKITVLSPDTISLQGLRDKYSYKNNRPFERCEGDQISEAKAPHQSDYQVPAENFNLNEWQEDRSVENGSSISVLIEYQNKKILWLADAYPNVVAASLAGLGYSPENPVVCDWVKIAHHGSRGNNSSQLYNLIRCEDYLISANAENRYYLPNKECLVRILCNEYRPPNSHYRFYFTYNNQLLQEIFKVDSKTIYSNLNFSTILSDDQMVSVQLG